MTPSDAVESACRSAASPSAAAIVAHAFADAVNRRSLDDLADLMTEDHVFADSLGNEVVGRDAMRHGWSSYWSMFPDYSIRVAETLNVGSVVVLVGTAQGTYAVDGRLLPENRWPDARGMACLDPRAAGGPVAGVRRQRRRTPTPGRSLVTPGRFATCVADPGHTRGRAARPQRSTRDPKDRAGQPCWRCPGNRELACRGRSDPGDAGLLPRTGRSSRIRFARW
jgi:hypothetical protein